jgi:nanoRNase/pAp phosphatase (c-di-AMP/oligoRNAs hydrolase)
MHITKINQVFYHDSCPDGSASALICAFAAYLSDHKNDINFFPIQYGSDSINRLVPQHNQLFVDITPPADRWLEWKSFNPAVLDHHESARKITEGLGGVYRNNEAHSGAMLAFEQFLEPLIRDDKEVLYDWEKVATLSMVRDTWKESHELWDDAQSLAHGFSVHETGDLINEIFSSPNARDAINVVKSVKRIGNSIYEKVLRKAYVIGKNSVINTIDVNGVKINVSFANNTEKITSEAGHSMIKFGSDLAVLYFNMAEGGVTKTVVSLRSNGKVSCSKLAEAFGGGGHENAAGFAIKPGDSMSQKSLSEMVYERLPSVL